MQRNPSDLTRLRRLELVRLSLATVGLVDKSLNRDIQNLKRKLRKKEKKR